MRTSYLGSKPRSCFLGITASISLFFLNIDALAHSRSVDRHVLTIETRIDRPHPQSGMKSKHSININFRSENVSQNFTTGTTVIFGKHIDSIRDKFRTFVMNWYRTAGHRGVTLHVSGSTASGVGFVPNIDYGFTIHITDDGEAAIKGCHDGFPSYSVKIGNNSLYHYKHKPLRGDKLFGTCDTKVRKNIGESHGWQL